MHDGDGDGDLPGVADSPAGPPGTPLPIEAVLADRIAAATAQLRRTAIEFHSLGKSVDKLTKAIEELTKAAKKDLRRPMR